MKPYLVILMYTEHPTRRETTTSAVHSSTIGIQRRDEALKQTEEVLHDQKEQIVTLNSEIIGYQHLIHQEEEKSEKNTAILLNVKGDHERLQKRIENAKTTHNKMMDDLALLKKTVDSVEGGVFQANEARSFSTLQHNKKQMAIKAEKSKKIFFTISPLAYI
ncbi:MAG: hypothetical protein EZS28_023611 [Streblomastix strix]|uniref:Uncharacterized protein n=1 Tax=Streblomastix strix TaxID=222440 RepID=A0A5J4VEI3_9EUKA|nr:MAG: hypothetical protein EZS28_023611 [Streblomastix strix]